MGPEKPMLSIMDNDRLTRVGPGTPMGELMRRYWHPIATTGQMADEPTKAIRILGESLVLCRDRSGTLGLLQESCPHLEQIKGMFARAGAVNEAKALD